MVEKERAYNFHKLINCANFLIQLLVVEYGKNGLKFDGLHNKMKNIWEELYPLIRDEVIANLPNYSGIQTNEDIVGVLKQSLKEA
jgi:hypothetical protein